MPHIAQIGVHSIKNYRRGILIKGELMGEEERKYWLNGDFKKMARPPPPQASRK